MTCVTLTGASIVNLLKNKHLKHIVKFEVFFMLSSLLQSVHIIQANIDTRATSPIVPYYHLALVHLNSTAVCQEMQNNDNDVDDDFE
jgi:hypothetical protein